MRVRAAVGTAFVVGLVAILVAPACVEISPVAVEVPPAPELTGPTAPNQDLEKIEKLDLGGKKGPEEITFDRDGRVYVGVDDGSILRLTRRSSGGADVTEVANTGGRPAGLAFDGSGRLIVCDAVKGLVAVESSGTVTTLSTEADGVKYGFADALDIASDAAVYFSDASSKWGLHDFMYDLLEGRPLGRLIRWRPETKQAEVLAKDLYFANGVVLSRNNDYVLVNETWAYRVRRYWLSGPKAGTLDTFIDDLPGFPDGISRSPRDTYWVALFTVRDPLGDWLAPHPTLKWMVANLPRFLMPGPKAYGFAIEVDGSGKILRSVQDPSGDAIRHVSSAHENGGSLYLGTLDGPHVGRYPLGG